MNSSKKSNSWEDELKTKWYLHHCEIQCLAVPDKFTTCEEEVIEFIKALLKEQREICKERHHLATHSLAGRYPTWNWEEIASAIIYAPEPKGELK